MNETKPRRPWRRRKRTWAAVVLWLAIAYPLGSGPVLYGCERRWLPAGTLDNLYYHPSVPTLDRMPGSVLDWWWEYLMWWKDAADRHNAASD